MSRGRPKIPRAVKIKQGTLQPCRDEGHESTLTYGAVTKISAPKSMGEEAALIWDRLTKKLIEYKILQDVDIEMLSLYCEENARMFRSIQALRVCNVGTKDYNAHAKILRECAALCFKISGQFGFSPSSRESLKSIIKSNDNPKNNNSMLIKKLNE